MLTIASKPGHNLELLSDNQYLVNQLDETKQEYRAKFEYLESILLEREEELRDQEEKRYYAEDIQIQTDLVGRDIDAMQYAVASIPKRKHTQKSPRMTMSGIMRSGTTVV